MIPCIYCSNKKNRKHSWPRKLHEERHRKTQVILGSGGSPVWSSKERADQKEMEWGEFTVGNETKREYCCGAGWARMAGSATWFYLQSRKENMEALK